MIRQGTNRKVVDVRLGTRKIASVYSGARLVWKRDSGVELYVRIEPQYIFLNKSNNYLDEVEVLSNTEWDAI